MRVPVLVYLILSQNFLHESLQKLILRLVAGLRTATAGEMGMFKIFLIFEAENQRWTKYARIMHG